MDAATKGTGRATELIEQLGDFFRVSALYPPNNARVQRTAQAVIALGSELRGDRPHVKVRLAHDGYIVDGQPVQSDKTNVEWLAETMRETALGGIDVSADVSIDSLLLFAKRLRENASPGKQSRTFATMWSEQVAGITPVERLFILSSAEWNQLPTELRSILDEDSARGARLREMLEASAPVIEQVTDLVETQDHVHGEMMVGGAVDLLRRIIDALPPETVEDPAACMQIVQRVLQNGAASLADLRGVPEERAAGEFRRMLIDASSRYFARPDSDDAIVEPAPVEDSAPRGHAGDERIGEDVTLFVAEYESLPDRRDLVLEAERADSPIEKLGICLHLLSTARDEKQAARIEGALTSALVRVAAPDEAMLRTYLDRLRGMAQELPWLGEFLERTGLLRHVIYRGVMSPQTMASMFPNAFGPYLDALRDDRDGVAALVDYLDELDTERVLAARDALLGTDPVLTRERILKLLATQSPKAMPFAWLALSARVLGDFTPVIEYLQKLKLTSAESAALRILENTRLPLRYLLALCERELGRGDDTSALARESEALLRAFIDECGEDVDVMRQVRAIGALDAFWSTRVEQYVGNLARSTGLLRLRKRPKPIRDAANTLLSTRQRRK